MTEQLRQAEIKALLRERQGYEQAGDKDGMAAVDKELAARGHELESKHKTAERRGGSRSRVSGAGDADAAGS